MTMAQAGPIDEIVLARTAFLICAEVIPILRPSDRDLRTKRTDCSMTTATQLAAANHMMGLFAIPR